jgi:hypothetical protein
LHVTDVLSALQTKMNLLLHPQAPLGAPARVPQPPQALRPGSLQLSPLIAGSHTYCPHFPQALPGAAERTLQPPQAFTVQPSNDAASLEPVSTGAASAVAASRSRLPSIDAAPSEEPEPLSTCGASTLPADPSALPPSPAATPESTLASSEGKSAGSFKLQPTKPTRNAAPPRTARTDRLGAEILWYLALVVIEIAPA